MKQETYAYFAKKITGLSWGAQAINIVGKCLTGLTAAFYLWVLFSLFMHSKYKECLVCLFVPMVTFFLVSIFRAWINQKRPYEVYDITPIIPKDTKGKSFPSRHIFSIYVIGTSVCFFSLPLGLLICVMGVFLAVIRVVTGVHFPKDVVFGAVIGILSGLITGGLT